MSEEIFKAIENYDAPRLRTEITRLRSINPDFDLDGIEKHKLTPIRAAIYARSDDCAMLLLDSGVDAKRVSEDDFRPTLLWDVLERPAIDEPVELVKKLIEMGVDIRSRRVMTGGAPMHSMAGNGKVKLMELLIGAGCEIDCVNSDGDSALIVAASAGIAPSVGMLLDAGAEMNFRGCGGSNALQRAINVSGLKVVELLAERGFDVHRKSAAGHTPLQALNSKDSHAALMCRLVLIAYGANPSEMSETCAKLMINSAVKSTECPTMRQAAILARLPKRLSDLLRDPGSRQCHQDDLPELIEFCAERDLSDMRPILEADAARQAVDDVIVKHSAHLKREGACP